MNYSVPCCQWYLSPLTTIFCVHCKFIFSPCCCQHAAPCLVQLLRQYPQDADICILVIQKSWGYQEAIEIITLHTCLAPFYENLKLSDSCSSRYCLYQLEFAVPVLAAWKAETQGRGIFCPGEEAIPEMWHHNLQDCEFLSIFVLLICLQKGEIGVGWLVLSNALFAVIHGCIRYLSKFHPKTKKQLQYFSKVATFLAHDQGSIM